MFSIALKELRENKKLSQKQLAADLHISQSTVGMWESGKREPNFEMLTKLADYFNVSTDYLIGNSDTPTPKSLDEQLEGVEFALFGEVKDLTDDQKRDILNYVKFVKSKGRDIK